jgi:hypothetical protein
MAGGIADGLWLMAGSASIVPLEIVFSFEARDTYHT